MFKKGYVTVTHVMPKHVLRLADFTGRAVVPFVIEPDAPARAALAEALNLIGLRKLRFEGTLSPMGRRDWRLEATLGATVTQACVITLAPVQTRIDEAVERSYVADFPQPEPGEIEMPEDDTVDPLPQSLDLIEVLTEALSLALPPFPKAEGASLDEFVVTEPGATPLTVEKAKPFAGLEDLKKALEKKDKPGD